MARLAVLALALAPIRPSCAAPVTEAAPWAAQPDEADTPSSSVQERIRRLEREALEAFRAEDYAEAERVLKVLTGLDGDNHVPWYNLACALSLQGRPTEAFASLQVAIARGFTDVRTLRTDPDLAAMRELDEYRALESNWDRVMSAVADKRFEAEAAKYGPRYTTAIDEQRRLRFISAFDPLLFDEARAQIERMHRWWLDEVLPADEPMRGIEGWTPAWVLVVLPTRDDYARRAFSVFGDGWERVGGLYLHDRKELVSKDLGSTLRHEFWHVLHWRHMDRLRQRHPIWIQEGLCSLVEDVEEDAAGHMRVLPSWRTNIVRRNAKAGRLMKWELLFSMDQQRFRTRPSGSYAQARAVFHFLHDEGRLRDWYTAYVRGFDDDPTGLRAMETAFGAPVDEVEKRYRDWARDLPEIAETVRPGMANLPFEVADTRGDGLEVTSFITRTSARSSGLKSRDVITAVNGRQVRDMNDLVRILSGLRPGAEVELSYLRRGQHGTATVTLVAQP